MRGKEADRDILGHPYLEDERGKDGDRDKYD